MDINFNTLPDLIIEEILQILELKDQVKLRYCNKRISWLLKCIVFEEVPVPQGYDMRNNYDENHVLKYMAPQIGKYVKRLNSFVDKSFFEVMDKFSKLEHLEVDYDSRVGVFNQLHLLDIKLKSLHLSFYESFPTQLQFNFNHVVENLVELSIILWNGISKHLEALEMLQIPNLKALELTIYYFPAYTLININRNFPDLKILSLTQKGTQLELILTPTVFLKLKKLSLLLSRAQNYHQFPFQSFPQLKVLNLEHFTKAQESDIKIIKEKIFKQLLGLSIQLPKLLKEDVNDLQNLKYANLELQRGFDAECMQRLLSLPKLNQLTLRFNTTDNIFENVTCTSPLYNLTLQNDPKLSQHFIKFLQFNAPFLTKLTIRPSSASQAFETSTYNKLECSGRAFKTNTICGLGGQSNLNLLFLKVYKKEESFINWIKAQSPNVYVTYFVDYF